MRVYIHGRGTYRTSTSSYEDIWTRRNRLISEMIIENKIVLVTGGANGIGFASATELLRNGAAHVAILDLANSNGEEAVSKLNGEFGKGRAIFIICDVTKPKELEDGFAKTIKEFGGLDIVINNAGVLNDLQWELEININFTAVVRGTLLGLQYMGKDRGGKGGVIVNVASILGVTPLASFPVYVATKHAVIGLSRSFAMPYHYEKTGVRVLTMCPGVTDTELVSKTIRKTLDILGPEFTADDLDTLPKQKIENVTHNMISIIRSAQNGSVWIAEAGEPVYEISIPDRFTMKISA